MVSPAARSAAAHLLSGISASTAPRACAGRVPRVTSLLNLLFLLQDMNVYTSYKKENDVVRLLELILRLPLVLPSARQRKCRAAASSS